MKAYDIIKKIENFCPSELAYSWDNVGLLCGDDNKEIKKVFLTLDANISTVKEAVLKKADIIISHHPILLGGIKKINYKSPVGQMIKLLIENDIPLFAAHTNMDTASGGINDKLAEIFELNDIKILEYHTDNINTGLGRYGNLTEAVSFGKFAEICSKKLNTTVRASGNSDSIIKTVAVASGSCSEIIPTAKQKGADVIITGDMKYHNTIDMVEEGICIIDAGHYPTEICVIDIFEDILKDTGIEIIKSENTDIFRFV